MVMKGAVKADHIPKNNFELIIVGLPPILITEMSGLEQETESAEMPDRTVVSGGNVKASEHDIKTFEHHKVETAALELWRREGVDPVSATYKKSGTLIKRSISGAVASVRLVSGVWVKKRTDDDLEMANEGEPAMITWLLSIDKID
jgi:hypothetical protein